MEKVIQKATSRGQITLPAKWRRQFKTNSYIIELRDTDLKIKPTLLGKDMIVFNAARDNKGKGIIADNFIKIIDSMR